MKPEDIRFEEHTLGGAGAAARDAASAVRVRWLGTAGFAIEHARHTLLIDPYLTRASLARCAFSPLVPDERAIRAHISRADAIVVGHTHFDHALDVPLIARITGAKVFGSRSAATLCRASFVREQQIDVVESPVETVREVGPFRLRFVPSAHSRFAFGRVPFAGDIADCDEVPLRTSHYKCGAVFAVEIEVGGKKLFHLGSAELVDASLAARNIDLAMMCVAGWTSSDKIPERMTRALSPGAVLLSHWDDFFRPIEKRARALPAMQLPRLVDRLHQATRDAKIGTLPILGSLTL